MFDTELEDDFTEENILVSLPSPKRIEKRSEFLQDVQALAIKYIDEFFNDKMMHCGGSIPKRLLHADERVSMVINFNIIKGVDKAYSTLEKELSSEDIDYARRTGNITSDVRLVNETLNLLSRSKIPQQFAGGMLIMYLEFVEGVDFAP